ncbi:hypothetical protein BV321_04018 [Pseudomonas syringae pv. actinidiae]|nr:hypothetical protein BV343_03890 [Pseudomonas syringae pv. actinidiae]OSN41862.1 hypothetical protein BV344_03883 [Pseudomonas syringae pv. actinidiae]OSR35050.1 hypothetical protein BV320_03943 [Pseudomonas syringae pv. actinidiae]OSR35609.1 hypothetical protein BV321_04018 [Pseudomonas syringae pv. actinidiae]OSR35896.1 hypothetical protein BV322_04004 [Pseudomonas syringae pv. actinidiae]
MLGAQVGRRGAKKGLESGIYLTDIAEPLCDAERHKEDAERPELRYHAERRTIVDNQRAFLPRWR